MKSYSGIGRYIKELLNAGLSAVEIQDKTKPYSLAEQVSLPKMIDKQNAELVHFPHINQPIRKIKTTRITTVHDLTMLDFPLSHKMTIRKRVKQFVLKLSFRRILRLNQYLITPSEFVASKLVERFGVSKSKITVVNNGSSSLGGRAEKPAGDLPESYYLYVGNSLPHKNVEILVELCKQNDNIKVILAGKRDLEYDEVLHGAPANCMQLDSPSDAELVWLYENAKALIFPSLSEGFGLPGLEAMQNGCPVISSDAACLPEIYGSAVLYFNPRSVDSLVKRLEEINNSETRARLIKDGHSQVKKYSWQKAAETTQDVYNNHLSQD